MDHDEWPQVSRVAAAAILGLLLAAPSILVTLAWGVSDRPVAARIAPGVLVFAAIALTAFRNLPDRVPARPWRDLAGWYRDTVPWLRLMALVVVIPGVLVLAGRLATASLTPRDIGGVVVVGASAAVLISTRRRAESTMQDAGDGSGPGGPVSTGAAPASSEAPALEPGEQTLERYKARRDRTDALPVGGHLYATDRRLIHWPSGSGTRRMHVAARSIRYTDIDAIFISPARLSPPRCLATITVRTQEGDETAFYMSRKERRAARLEQLHRWYG